MKQHTIKGVKQNTLPVALLYGCGLGWLITIAMGIVIAWMVDGELMKISAISSAAVVAIILSAFAATVVSSMWAGKRRLPVCLLAGAIYYVGLLGINAIFFDGKYQGMLAGVLCVMGVAFGTGMIKPGYKKRKYPYPRNRHNI